MKLEKKYSKIKIGLNDKKKSLLQKTTQTLYNQFLHIKTLLWTC